MSHREVMQLALEALEALRKCITCWPDETWAPHEFAAMDRSSDAITALRAALAQQEQEPYAKQAQYFESAGGGVRINPVTGDVGIGTPTTQQEQATVKESLPVGQEEPEGGWQPAPSPQVTQRIADMPMSEYRRGVNDGFKLGLREGRIKAEDEMREQQEQEPHWLTKELMADYLDMVAEAIENDSSETLRHKAHWMRRDGEV